MSGTEHPDDALARLLSRPKLGARKKTCMMNVHELCRERLQSGERDFGIPEIGRAVSAAGIFSFSTYVAKSSRDYQEIAKAWQAFGDDHGGVIAPAAPPSHPDQVLKRLAAGRLANRVVSLRAVHMVCKTRYERGEQDFRPAAVGAEMEAAGIYTKATITAGAAKVFSELLGAWQSLAMERGLAPDPTLPAGHPHAVLTQLLRSPTRLTRQDQYLRGVQEVCEVRFNRGEYDFGTAAVARDLVAAGVFVDNKALTHKLASVGNYRAILQSWQTKADARWINSNPDLPATHPDAVFRRLSGKTARADKLRNLIKLHRLCFSHHATGSKDFSIKTIGHLCAEQDLMSAQTLHATSVEDYRTLVAAWADHARPWLQGGQPPEPMQPRRQKSHDIGLEWVRRDYPHLERWRTLATEWLAGVGSGLSQRIDTVAAFFQHYLTAPGVPPEPEDLLRRGAPVADFSVITNMTTSNRALTRTNCLHEFFQWVLLRDFSIEADDGELVVSPACRNPIQRLSARTRIGPSQSVRSPLPYGFIQELRRILAAGPCFRDWTFAQNAQGATIGETGAPGRDWFIVDPAVIDHDDPDCVWRRRELNRGQGNTRVVYQMWSPVRWVAVLVKLMLPLRTAQVRFLDSGESDTWRYENGSWAHNTHPLAPGPRGSLWQQGVLRRHLANGHSEAATLLYISTNKTADQEKDGPHKGYVMPWFVAPDPAENVFYWLEKLRNWQEKYNPIKRRTSWTELDGRHTSAKTAAQLKSYADTCFLFRVAEAEGAERMLPISDAQVSLAWVNVLEELQDLLAARGEAHPDGTAIVLVNRNGLNDPTTNFPLHSLRVSLITALALDGEVPFPILQKLVGHSRLIMTLYYTKPGHARVSSVLEEAAARLEASKERSIHSFLLNAHHELLVERTVTNSTASLLAAIPVHPAERNAAGWMPMHIGICLVGGNVSEFEDNRRIGGCYNGGREIGSTGFGPVPGGSRNCVRCRWFVTEPHYLPALAAHFNTVAYHFDEARMRSLEAERTLQAVRRAKAELEASGHPTSDEQRRLREAERIWESALKRFSDLSEDLVACWRLIERCKVVLNAGGSGALQLVLQGSETDVRAVFEETASELLQLCGVCDGVELYPDEEAGKAVLRRSQLLDSALYNEGLPPMFMKLNEADQLKVGNAFLRRLSYIADPDSPLIGQRKVVEIVDAGGKLSERLGIDLSETLINLSSDPPKPLRLGAPEP